MACGCGCGAATGCGEQPCPPGPRETHFCVETAQTLGRSLGRKLIGVVDKIRDIDTRLGFRPYVVRLVYTRWSGGVRDVGEESVISEERLLPTPLMLDLQGVASVVTVSGSDEQGGVMLTEVSGCYTEEQLRGLGDQGQALPADQSFYYEIEFLRVDGVDGERRRFTIGGAPEYDADNYLWRFRLVRQRPDRSRHGMPR